MMARITKIFLLLQFGIAAVIYIFIFKYFSHNTFIALFSAFSCILLLRLVITANSFFIARHYRSALPHARRLRWRQAYRLFLAEFRASVTSSSWTMPFHRVKKCVVQEPAALPVLLIHGYGANSGYWRAMSKALQQADILHHGIDLEPVFGNIDHYTPAVHHAIETLCQETGKEKIVIVAHSMGGLVARAYLRAHSDMRIAKLITLGTPHNGTGWANLGLGKNSAQMRWDNGISSQWLQELAAAETAHTRTLIVSIYSHHDNIVTPQTSAHLSGAHNIALYGIGHVSLACDKSVQTTVIDEIRSTSSQ
jgi:triacylglycerol lipase